MELDYFEIRACVDFGDRTESFLGRVMCNPDGSEWHTPQGAQWEARNAAWEANVNPRKVFWTLYMWTTNRTLVAVGDFKTFDAAYQVQCAILAPMRKAADMVANDDGYSAADAGLMLEDICNQSTTEERL